MRILEGQLAGGVQSCWLDRIPRTAAQRGLLAHDVTHARGQAPSAFLGPAGNVSRPCTKRSFQTKVLDGSEQRFSMKGPKSPSETRVLATPCSPWKCLIHG